MKKIFLYISFLALYTEGVAQTSAFDQQVISIQQSPDDTVKIRLLYDIALRYTAEDIEKGLTHFQSAYSLAQKLNAHNWLPELERHMGYNYSCLSRNDSAIYYLNQARQGFEKQNNLVGLANTYIFLRLHYRVVTQFKLATEVAFKTLGIYEQLKDDVGIARAQSGIAEIYNLQEKNLLAEGLKYAQKAYDFQKKLPQPSEDLARTCRNLGDIWLNVAQKEIPVNVEIVKKALVFQTEGVTLRRALGDKANIARALTGYGNAFKYLKQYDKTLAAYEEGWLLCKQIQFKVQELSFSINLSDAYNLTGQYQKALKVAFETNKLMHQTHNNLNLADNCYIFAEAYLGLGKSDSVYYYCRLREHLRDSIVSGENDKQMVELQTQYETSQKETQIAEQKTALEKQKTQFWIVITFLGLALLAGSLLYRLTRQLRQRNKEKEFLIKEIHHRVKNNLQILSSLLYLQSRNIKDDAALGAVREGQNRVKAMGLIHEKLYMGDNLAAVEMKDYMQNLADNLLDTFGIYDDRIKIVCAVPPLTLDVDTAIPLGLVANELVTNSLKYAFPKDFGLGQPDVGGTSPKSDIKNPKYTEGVISIALYINETKQLCLKVADNGVGNGQQPSEGLKPSEGSDYHKNSTRFGTNLIQTLSKKLQGKVEVLPVEMGYATLIRFEDYKVVAV